MSENILKYFYKPRGGKKVNGKWRELFAKVGNVKAVFHVWISCVLSLEVLDNQRLLDGDFKVAAPGKTGPTYLLRLQGCFEPSHSGPCPVLEPNSSDTEHAEVLIREGITALSTLRDVR